MCKDIGTCVKEYIDDKEDSLKNTKTRLSQESHIRFRHLPSILSSIPVPTTPSLLVLDNLPLHTRQSVPLQMLLQRLFAFLVHGRTSVDSQQAVLHHQLVVGRCNERCRDVNEKRDPAKVHVCEAFTAEEHEVDEAGSEVAGEV